MKNFILIFIALIGFLFSGQLIAQNSKQPIMSCTHTNSLELRGDVIGAKFKKPNAECKIIDFAVAVDSRFLAHQDGGAGTIVGAENKVREIVGHLNDLYDPLGVTFVISEIYVSQSLSTDASPIGTMSDVNTQTVTSSWAATNFTSNYDLAAYLTGDDIPFAWAWGGAGTSLLCGPNRYCSSIISYTPRQTAQLLAHEIGHNLGVPHISGSTNIMNPTIYPANDQWSSQASTMIINNIATSACVATDSCTISLSVDFSADKLTISEGESITFVDLSDASTIAWSWEFSGGTPTTSTQQNPTVTYNSPGIYPVKLTVSNGTESNTLIKAAYITVVPDVTDLYTVSGTVQGNNIPTSEGVVILFNTDLTMTNVYFGLLNNGDFSIDNVPVGNYILYAIPNVLQGDFLPTFYPNSLTLANAFVLNVTDNVTDVDLSLVPFPQGPSGSGSINGNLGMLKSPCNSNLFTQSIFHGITPSGKPSNVVMLLHTAEDDKIVAYSVSDENGDYSFGNLVAGNYYVTSATPFFNMKSRDINLVSDNSTETEVNLLISCGTLNVDQLSESKSELLVYPIPANNELTIVADEYKEDVKITLRDVTGKIVAQQLFSGSRTTLDVSDFSNGIYLLKVGNDTSKLIISH